MFEDQAVLVAHAQDSERVLADEGGAADGAQHPGHAVDRGVEPWQLELELDLGAQVETTVAFDLHASAPEAEQLAEEQAVFGTKRDALA